ncbi:hypothetical protein BDV95DRAFT_606220 [Massariosphaeria phaeospora]|uniref:CorA-like transporter domain-containing protein n=1 Tax=Massariosphaeria phaeospora TaxID=100035 RepID=A0A7C8IB18_9PLEO|nr:hypothetical protein BDV95DRAFT_606220 [Massariosphaeria phaeospora]
MTLKACKVELRYKPADLPKNQDEDQEHGQKPHHELSPGLVAVDPDLTRLQDIVTETAQTFRVFYIRQLNSFARLGITRDLFDQLLSACHVFPKFNEYMIGFRVKQQEAEIAPPPMRFRPLMENDKCYGFECAYMLRYVEFTNRPGNDPYSLRHFAVSHKYGSVTDIPYSTWILAGMSHRTEPCLDRFSSGADDIHQANPFELHIMFLDTTSDRAILMTPGNQSVPNHLVSVDIEDLQKLKCIEDDIADSILCLKSTSRTISTLLEMHKYYSEHISCDPLDKGLQSSYGSGPDAIEFALEECQDEVVHNREMAESLLSKLQSTKSLISSLLKHQRGYNLDQQMDTLHSLEQQAQEVMRQLIERINHELANGRILTIITLVYLACTVVSSFVAKQQTSSGIRVMYSQNSWLFFAMPILLTAFTLLIWYTWVHFNRMTKALVSSGEAREKGYFHRMSAPVEEDGGKYGEGGKESGKDKVSGDENKTEKGAEGAEGANGSGHEDKKEGL